MRKLVAASLSVFTLLALVALAVGPLAPTAVAQDPQPAAQTVKLAWKFQPGTITTYRVTEQVKESTTDSAQSVDTTQTTTITWDQKVEAVDANGVATLTLTYKRVEYRQQSSINAATPVTFDSDNPEDRQRAESDLALKPFLALLGQSFTINMNATGEVTAVNGYTAMLDKLFEGLNEDVFVRLKAALSAQFSDDAMKVYLGQLFQLLPGSAVSKGHNWNRTISHDVLFIGTLGAEQSYTLEGVSANAGGSTIAKVGITTIYDQVGPAANAPGADALEGFTITGQGWQGRLDGTMSFNADLGRIESMELKQEMQLAMEARSTAADDGFTLTYQSKVSGTIKLEVVAE